MYVYICVCIRMCRRANWLMDGNCGWLYACMQHGMRSIIIPKCIICLCSYINVIQQLRYLGGYYSQYELCTSG